LAGVSFLEVFGLGKTQCDAVDFLRQIAGEVEPEIDGVQFGLQPHAPYSCGLEVYQAAANLNLPVSTHLAETPEELEFVARATGPLRDMLQGIGVWDDSIQGHDLHAVDALAEVLASRPWVMAHLNYIEERHLGMLAGWPITIAYCPRASAYFGHANHRYQQMMEAGVRVALGTDSILCLDTPDRISVLDEMRLLYRRDGTDPHALLRFATTNGATALGFDPRLATLGPGEVSGVLGVRIDPKSDTDPLIQALTNNHAPEWIVGPVQSQESWMSP
jgi:cytosine/adenosine deaminase-related metal-dependent hydrolase